MSKKVWSFISASVVVFAIVCTTSVLNAQSHEKQMHKIWELVIDTKTTESHLDESGENQRINTIQSLKEDDLRYFLDLGNAIWFVENNPSLSSTERPRNQIDTRKLLKLVEANVFEKIDINRQVSELTEEDKKYVETLALVVDDIVFGTGTTHFPQELVALREITIRAVNEHNIKIYSDYETAQFLFKKYGDEIDSLNLEGIFNLKRDSSLNTDESSRQGGCAVQGFNSYVVAGDNSWGNSGSSYYFASQNPGGDCDHYFKYFNGGAPAWTRYCQMLWIGSKMAASTGGST